MNLLVATAAGGLLVGFWHFGSLHWLCTRLLRRPGWALLAALHALRFAILITAGVWAARQGAAALVAATAGLLLARAALIARERRVEKAEP